MGFLLPVLAVIVLIGIVCQYLHARNIRIDEKRREERHIRIDEERRRGSLNPPPIPQLPPPPLNEFRLLTEKLQELRGRLVDTKKRTDEATARMKEATEKMLKMRDELNEARDRLEKALTKKPPEAKKPGPMKN